MPDLNPIFDAVRLAAELCRRVQQRHIIRSEKGGHEPVTIADYGAQAIICRALKTHFPNDGVMAEESGAQFSALLTAEQQNQIAALIGEVIGISVTESDIAGWLDHGAGAETRRIWVVDPIDGTKGFLAARHYVHAVGILEDRQPTGAVIGAPAYPGGGRLFHALNGVAYVQSLTEPGEPQPVRASKRVSPEDLRALESADKGHASQERMARVRAAAGMLPAQIDRADSQEKYTRIAAGDAELYLRLPRLKSTRPHSIWDHAPGTALVQAAGGKVTGTDGEPLDFSTGTALRNHGIVATNGPIHDRVIDAVQQILAQEARTNPTE